MLLDQLMDRQEQYRGLLQSLREDEDKSFVEATVAAHIEGADDNILINVAVVLDQIMKREGDEVDENDLLGAIEFIDHLDTLNLRIVAK